MFIRKSWLVLTCIFTVSHADIPVVSLLDVEVVGKSISAIELTEFQSAIEVGLSNNRNYFSIISRDYNNEVYEILIKSSGPLTQDDLFKIGNALTEDYVIAIQVWKKRKNLFSKPVFGAKLKWIDIRTNKIKVITEYSASRNDLTELLVSRLIYTLYKGTITIFTNFENYELLVDDNSYYVRSKQYSLTLPEGRHIINMSKPEYRAIVDTIIVKPGNTYPIHKTFIKRGSEVRINGTPSEAVILISNEDIDTRGQLPDFKQQLPEGTYSVAVKAPGFFPYEFDLKVVDRQSETRAIDLQPIPTGNLISRSLLYPGLGHIYSGRKLRGYSYVLAESAVLAIGGYFIYLYIQDMRERDNLYDSYYQDKAFETRTRIRELEDRMAFYNSIGLASLSTAIGIYIYDIYDVVKMNRKAPEYQEKSREKRENTIRSRSRDAFDDLDRETDND